MSHYVENMFSVGEVPWHGLGTVLEDPPKIEDAIRLAGLDWEVQMDDVEIKSKVLDLSVTLPAPKFKGLVRIGNNHLSSQVYAVVSDVYKPVQNIEAFRFFQPMLSQGLVTLESAGSLKEGKIIWVLAKVPEDILIPGGKKNRSGVLEDDIIRPYILLSNSHDGHTSVRMAFTPIRVVCWNTLSMTFRDQGVKVAHKGDVQARMRDVEINMSDLLETYQKIARSYERMSRVPVADSYADDFVQEFFQPADSSDSASVARSIKKQTNVLENFEIEPQTRWGLLNAFTGYIDYDARSKGGAGGRLSSIWFGSGAQRKTAAYKYLAHDVADIVR